MKKTIPVALASLALASLLAACAGGAMDDKALTDSVTFSATSSVAAPAAAPELGYAVGADGRLTGAPVLAAATDRSVVVTGSVVVEVKVVDDALAALRALAAAQNGRIAGLERQGDDSAFVTLRIPATAYDATAAAAAKLGRLVSENRSESDVTDALVDLDARLTNLRAAEKAYSDFLAKAKDATEVLAIYERVTATRGEIESLAAQQKSLRDQVAMSTLTVSLTTKPTPIETTQEGWDARAEVERAVASFVSIAQSVASATIFVAIAVVPFLIAVVVFVLLPILIVRRARRRPAAPVE